MNTVKTFTAMKVEDLDTQINNWLKTQGEKTVKAISTSTAFKQQPSHPKITQTNVMYLTSTVVIG